MKSNGWQRYSDKVRSNFELFDMISRGQSTTIYDGFDHSMQRAVVIKQLDAGARDDGARAARFWQEARFMGGLGHGNIVRVYAIDEAAGWVILERMEGDLKSVLPQGGVPADTVREIVRDILQGLSYLHSRGKLHGEITARNLLLDERGTAKLGFTLGIDLRDEFRKPGSSEYHFAPELLNAEQFGEPGYGVDLYALGMLAIELLCGSQKFKKLFKGVASSGPGSAMAWASWHASTETLPRCEKLLARVPPDLARVIDGLVQKHVADRYDSAEAALLDLNTSPHAAGLPDDSFVAGSTAAEGMPLAERTEYLAPRWDGDVRPVRTSADPETSMGNWRRVFRHSKTARFKRRLACWWFSLVLLSCCPPSIPRKPKTPSSCLRLRIMSPSRPQECRKNRVEQSGPDLPLSVGLVYGPSGCGKSSLVKAGLLPRLASHVAAVY